MKMCFFFDRCLNFLFSNAKNKIEKLIRKKDLFFKFSPEIFVFTWHHFCLNLLGCHNIAHLHFAQVVDVPMITTNTVKIQYSSVV